MSHHQELRSRLFWSGHSQAVRLPKEFRLDGDEVRLVRLGSGILITPIAKQPHNHSIWDDYFAAKPEIDPQDGFMDTRPLNLPHEKAALF